MNRLLIALPTLLLTLSVGAQQKLVPAQSEITFVAKQMGVPLDGKFSKFDAQLSLNPKKLESGKVHFSVDLGSVFVGDAETVKELKKTEWFNTPKFPTAVFTSTAIKSLGAGKLEVLGTLNIKGSVRPLTVPVVLTQAGTGVTLVQGSFVLKRIDFKIGDGDWADVSIVANDVTVMLRLAVTGL